MAILGRGQPFRPHRREPGLGTASVAVSGTITAAVVESEVVSGGKTIVLTVTGDTWVAAGGTFDAARQAILDGIDSAQSEATGWDLTVKLLQGVSGVVRTSDSVVTITLDAQVTYNITATETITATVPASALNVGVAIVASPTWTVTAAGTAAGHLVGGSLLRRGRLGGRLAA